MLLLVSAALLVLMLLYPPYHVVMSGGQFNAGYGWLFSPPDVRSAPGSLTRATVDVLMLLAQFLGVLIATAICYVALPPDRHTLSTVAGSSDASRRILDAIFESDAGALRAALSQAIAAEIGRRT